MSPSELSWLQGCVFLFLGVAGGYGLNRCQNRQTNGGTSGVELRSIRVVSEIATTAFGDVQSSSGDEEIRTSPSNLLNPVGEAMAFIGSPSCPDRSRLRFKSRRRCRRRLLKPPAKSRKTSLEFGAKMKAPNFVGRETDVSTIVADKTSSQMSSAIAGLLRLSVGEDEDLSPSHPVDNVLALSGTPSCPDHSGLRSKSVRRRRRRRRLLKPSAKRRKTSHFLKLVAKMEAPNFARIGSDYCTIVADKTSSPTSSTIAGHFRLSVDEDEALSPSHPVGEALALSETPSGAGRKRCRSYSCRRMNAPERRTKSPFENFMAQDEAWNIGTLELTNTVVADTSSTSMASTTAGLRRPPRRHFVPRPAREIPLVDHVQANTSDGLRRRPRSESQEPLGEVERFRFIGVRHNPLRKLPWFAEMRPPNSKNKLYLGAFGSKLEAASAIDAAFFYYKRPDLTNFLHRTPAMMAMLPPMSSSLRHKDKFSFVKDQAKRLAKYVADNREIVIYPSLDKIS